jgi:hypothetical protein
VEEIQDAWDGLLFSLRRSVRYHIKRRQHFERLDRSIKLVTAFSGLGVAGTLLSKVGETTTVVCAALVAFLSLFDLVYRTTDQAKLHQDLAKEFAVLEKEMILHAPSADTLRTLTGKRLDIEIEEPPPLRVLDSICHNELIRAMECDEAEGIPLKWYQVWLADLCDVGPGSIRKRGASAAIASNLNATNNCGTIPKKSGDGINGGDL